MRAFSFSSFSLFHWYLKFRIPNIYYVCDHLSALTRRLSHIFEWLKIKTMHENEFSITNYRLIWYFVILPHVHFAWSTFKMLDVAVLIRTRYAELYYKIVDLYIFALNEWKYKNTLTCVPICRHMQHLVWEGFFSGMNGLMKYSSIIYWWFSDWNSTKNNSFI